MGRFELPAIRVTAFSTLPVYQFPAHPQILWEISRKFTDLPSTLALVNSSGYWCAWRDSNSQDPGSEPGKATNYITRA